MRFAAFLLLLLTGTMLFAQEPVLPKGYSEEEKAMIEWYRYIEPPVQDRGIPDPPPEPVRHMAEWEELQALVVTWRGFPEILTEIVRHAREEVPVIIVVNNSNVQSQAEAMLSSNGISMTNITFLQAFNNSVWCRDYGPNCVYANDVEDLYFIDWVYNRITRPEDDVIPFEIGDHLDIPVYSTTEGDHRMVNTGGNFMSDGQGTAFASKLILEENEPGNIFNAGPHDEADIDAIMQSYMGIDRFVKMNTLLYDNIHHIDMHMRLLDETTLMVGQYPEGVSDGPQIEANIQYVLDHFQSANGTSYEIKRILQPPDFGGVYPVNGGDYRTYTNSVFINGTILIPTYETQYDTTALRIYRENFPGYKVVGINCNDMIWASGALHCITKEIGVFDPLRIVHYQQPDITDNELWDDYELTATIQHRSGISNAQVYWTTDTLNGYSASAMTLIDQEEHLWSATLPHQPDGSEIFYYIQAEANSTKSQVRPLPAPEAYYHFRVDGNISSVTESGFAEIQEIYPNPASAITVIPVQMGSAVEATIEIADLMGRKWMEVYSGQLQPGPSNHFFNAALLPSGVYLVILTTPTGQSTRKLVVK